MVSKSDKADYAIYLRDDRHSAGYRVVIAEVVKLKSCDEVDWMHSYEDWYHLRVRAQMHREATQFYGYRVHFADVDVNAYNVDGMAKVLKGIQRKLDKEDELRGVAGDFAEYVVRVALALGIPRMIRHTPGAACGEYTLTSLPVGASYIRRLESDWAAQHATTTSVA